MRLPIGQNHDPWWDMDGQGVKRLRRKRVTFSLGILAVAGVLLVLVWGVLPVRAASTGVNLDQWASSDHAWQNGNLNGNNSRYPEGGIVPFRLAMEGMSVGSHSIHINYDFTANGHKAYDFLATWDVTNAKGKICGGAGGGISSKCPSLGTASSYAFPTDNYKANGLSVHGAELYSAAPRRLTIWGGTITSISGPVHSGSPDGNSSADFLVRFKATRSAVELAWGWIGGVVAGIIGSANADTHQELEDWNTVALAGTGGLIVGFTIGGAAQSSASRLTTDYSKLGWEPTQAQVDAYNEALRTQLGLSPEQAWSILQNGGPRR
jgi:hypothetical protein